MNPKVFDYIQTALEKGFSESQVRDKLKTAGLTDEEITSAISNVKNSSHASLKGKQWSLKKKLIAGFVVLTFLGLVLILFLIYTDTLKLYLHGIETTCVGCIGKFINTGDCYIPCINKCNEYGMGMTSAYKTFTKGSVTCICNCDKSNDLLAVTKAVVTRDVSICDSVSFTELSYQDYCYSMVARAKGDALLCEKILLMSGSGSRDECYNYVAGAIQDKAVCDKVSVQSGFPSKDSCLVLVSQKTGDLSICDDVNVDSGFNSRDVCLIFVAVVTKNPSICENIKIKSGYNSQDACYALVAGETGDSSLCEKIVVTQGDNSKDVCYTIVASTKNDRSLCYKVTSYSQETCFNELEG